MSWQHGPSQMLLIVGRPGEQAEFGKECVRLEKGMADHQAASQFCLFPLKCLFLLRVAPPLPCSQALATWLTSCSSISIASPSLTHTPSVISLFFFPSLPFPPPHTSSLQNRARFACVLHTAIFHPTTLFLSSPQPGHAGSPAGGPDGVLASGPALGSLSLQDGSAALLWPIWPRPVLAPVCDYGPAGRRQSWRRERCQCAAE